jgi:hypothetical protein
MRRPVAGTVALLIAIAAASCAQGATIEPSSTPLGTASAGLQTAFPSISPSGLPSQPDIPAGLPVMPGAQVVNAQPADPGHIARWMADDIGPDVYAFYLDALPATGFVIEERFPGGNVAVIRFSTPDGTVLDLALIGEGDGERTRIDLRLPEGS